MASPPVSKPPAAVVDACFIIGFCAKEVDKYSAAKAKLEEYANDGWQLFAPGVLVGEVLYVLCRKLQDGVIDSVGYNQAITTFIALMNGVCPPPFGDASLIRRAEQIRSGYGCARANDALYLALAEQLKSDRHTKLATFDAAMKNHAVANAPSVDVDVLTVLKP